MITSNETVRGGCFTPWATVTCYECNNEAREATLAKLAPGDTCAVIHIEPTRVEREGKSIAQCDTCGATIGMDRDDVGELCALREVLRERMGERAPDLWQTGGMCVALGVDDGDERGWELLIVVAEVEEACLFNVAVHHDQWDTQDRNWCAAENLTITGAADLAQLIIDQGFEPFWAQRDQLHAGGFDPYGPSPVELARGVTS